MKRLPTLLLIAIVLFTAVLDQSSPVTIEAQAQTPRVAAPILQAGHSGFPSALAISPDGNSIISGDASGTLKFWDRLTGNQVLSMKAHRGSVNTITISADGSSILTGGEDAVLALWDLETGKVKKFLTGHVSPIHCVAFSPDGKFAASAGGSYGNELGLTDNVIRIWDLSSGRLINVLRGHTRSIVELTFSRRGTEIASSSRDNSVRIWDTTGTAESIRIPTEAVDAVFFSPDGTTVASSMPEKVMFWDAKTGSEKSSIRHDRFSTYSHFTSDWRFLYVGGGDTQVWDVARKTLVKTLSNKTEMASITPDGRFMAGVEPEPLTIWDTARDASVQEFGRRAASTDSTTGVTFSRSGRLAAWIGSPVASPRINFPGNGIYVFDWETRQISQTIATPEGDSINEVAISPDEKSLASCGGDGVHIYSLVTAALTNDLNGGLRDEMACNSVAYSPDGTKIALSGSIIPLKPGSNEPDYAAAYLAVRQLDTKSGRIVNTMRLPPSEKNNPKAVIHSIAFSPDGKTIATGDDVNGLLLWESRTGRPFPIKGQDDGILSVSFDLTGTRIATGGFDNKVRIWDTASRTLQQTIPGAQGPASSVRFTPDGKRLVIGSYDEAVRIHEFATGLSTPLYAHTSSVNFVSVHPDGKTVLSSGLDGLINVWSVRNRTLVSSIYMDGSNGVNFTPDGYYYELGSSSKGLLAWREGERTSFDASTARTYYRPDIIRSRYQDSSPVLVPISMQAEIARTEEVAWSEHEKMLRREWRDRKYYAVVIGNDSYKNPWSKLTNSVNDAQAVENLLEQKFGFKLVLPLYNATKSEIQKALRTIAETAEPNSSFVLFYSGHGQEDAVLDKAYWIPVDGTRNRDTWISSDEVFASLNAIKSRHSLIIADSCFAGAFDKAGTMFEVFDEPAETMLELMKMRSRTLISSGGDEPVSGSGDKHSIFAEYLLEGLKSMPRNIFAADKLFYEFLYREIVLRQLKQRPRLRNLNHSIAPKPTREESGERFYFVRN